MEKVTAVADAVEVADGGGSALIRVGDLEGLRGDAYKADSILGPGTVVSRNNCQSYFFYVVWSHAYAFISNTGDYATVDVGICEAWQISVKIGQNDLFGKYHWELRDHSTIDGSYGVFFPM